jgi:hypothetical protein
MCYHCASPINVSNRTALNFCWFEVKLLILQIKIYQQLNSKWLSSTISFCGCIMLRLLVSMCIQNSVLGFINSFDLVKKEIYPQTGNL